MVKVENVWLNEDQEDAIELISLVAARNNVSVDGLAQTPDTFEKAQAIFSFVPGIKRMSEVKGVETWQSLRMLAEFAPIAEALREATPRIDEVNDFQLSAVALNQYYAAVRREFYQIITGSQVAVAESEKYHQK